MRRGAFGLATAVLSTLVVSGLNAAPASASTTYPMPSTGQVTLKGHGWGHGHGMSQYGAQGAALQGKTWQEITAFYYPGTSRSVLKRGIRVDITAATSPTVTVASRDGLTVTDTGSNETRTLPVNGADRWRLVVTSANGTGVDYRMGTTWKRWWTFAADGAFFAAGQPIRLYYGSTSRQYRGRLIASRPSATSTARDTVNYLSLENYVRGVVPAEMPTSWDPDAVATQAVAARTYAAYEIQHPRAANFHVCDTSACQVYGGYDSEAVAGNAAVDASRNVVLTYGGQPAFTQFSSSSGGWTSAGSFSYLPSKSDPYDAWKRSDGTYGNPNHNWSVKVDVSRLEKMAGVVDLRSVELLRPDGHHVSKVVLHGATKSKTFYGDDFRSALGLKSTYFAF